MAQHRLSARVELSLAAEKRFLKACKVQGGQTLFIEEAIEFYVRESNVMEKLESIERVLMQRLDLVKGTEDELNKKVSVPESDDLTSMSKPSIDDVSIKQPDISEVEFINTQQEIQHNERHQQTLNNGIGEATLYTLRSLIGEDAL